MKSIGTTTNAPNNKVVARNFLAQARLVSCYCLGWQRKIFDERENHEHLVRKIHRNEQTKTRFGAWTCRKIRLECSRCDSAGLSVRNKSHLGLQSSHWWTCWAGIMEFCASKPTFCASKPTEFSWKEKSCCEKMNWHPMNSGYICPSGEKSLSEFSLRCCRLSEAFNRSISNNRSGIFLDWNIPLFFI